MSQVGEPFFLRVGCNFRLFILVLLYYSGFWNMLRVAAILLHLLGEKVTMAINNSIPTGNQDFVYVACNLHFELLVMLQNAVMSIMQRHTILVGVCGLNRTNTPVPNISHILLLLAHAKFQNMENTPWKENIDLKKGY